MLAHGKSRTYIKAWVGTSVTRCWDKNCRKYSKKCQKVNKSGFAWNWCFQSSAKVTKYLSYLMYKICTVELWKIYQSGHTDDTYSFVLYLGRTWWGCFYSVKGISQWLQIEKRPFSDEFISSPGEERLLFEKRLGLEEFGIQFCLMENSVWPDLANLKVFGHLLQVLLVVVKILKLIWQF